MSVNPSEPAVVAPAAVSSTANAAQSALEKKAGSDWNKANESYFNAVNELGRTKTVVEQLAQRNQQLESALASFAGGNGRQPASDDPLAALQTELGLPIEPFDRAIKASVAKELQTLLGPVLEQAQADETLSGEIENFDQLKNDARKHMKEHPEIAEVFNAVRTMKPVEAWKYAIRETLIAQGTAPAPLRPPGAGLSEGRTVVGSGMPPVGSPDAMTRENEALTYFRQYGDQRPYVKERLSQTSVRTAIKNALRQAGYEVPAD